MNACIFSAFKGGISLKKRKLLILSASLLLLLSSCVPTAYTGQPKAPVFTLDELPDIGEYSGKNPVRFHKNASNEFVPDESYGTLVPFIGRAKEYKADAFDTEIVMTYTSMGLCTKDGEIVVPPFDGYINFNDYYNNFPFYQLTPYSDEAADMMMQPDSVVLPLDGSWKMDLPSGSWLCGAGDGVVSVLESDPETYDFVGLACYDYNGNKLFEKEGVWSAGNFSHGYANVHIGEDELSSCYIDKTGKIVSEKYQYCSYFNEHGIAYINEYEGKSYLIDTDFSRISDIYESIYSYSDNYITARSADHTDIFSTDGSFIASVSDSGFISVHGNRDNLIYSYYDDGNEIYKKLDGTIFVNEKGQSPNIFTQAEGYFSYKDHANKSNSVFGCDGKIIAVLENCDAVISVLEDEKLIIYTKGSYDFEEFENGRPIYTDPIRTVIYDFENGKELAVLDGQGSVLPSGKDERYIIFSIFLDYDFGGTSRYYLFDTETEKFIFSDCLKIEYYDVGEGYFSVANEEFCTLYDKDLNKVLRLINE